MEVNIFKVKWGIGEAVIIQYPDHWEAYELPVGEWCKEEVLTAIEAGEFEYLSWGIGDYDE